MPSRIDLRGFSGLVLRGIGDGKTYCIVMRTSAGVRSGIEYVAQIASHKNKWESIRVLISSFGPVAIANGSTRARARPSLTAGKSATAGNFWDTKELVRVMMYTLSFFDVSRVTRARQRCSIRTLRGSCLRKLGLVYAVRPTKSTLEKIYQNISTWCAEAGKAVVELLAYHETVLSCTKQNERVEKLDVRLW